MSIIQGQINEARMEVERAQARLATLEAEAAIPKADQIAERIAGLLPSFAAFEVIRLEESEVVISVDGARYVVEVVGVHDTYGDEGRF